MRTVLTFLQGPASTIFPTVTQIHSNNSKAAVTMIKGTKGSYIKEAKSLNMVEILTSAKCLKRHHHLLLRFSTSSQGNMILLFANYPKLTILEDVKKQNNEVHKSDV